MARVHKVTASRKDHTCGRGGHVIPKGEPYLWAKPGFRTRTPHIRCVQHPFRPSELTTSLASEPMAAAEAALESLEEVDLTSVEALDELTTILEEVRSAAEEYASTRREAADAWENGNSTLEELADTADEAVSTLDGVDIVEWDGDVDARDEGDEEAQAEWEQHVQDQADALRDAIESAEF